MLLLIGALYAFSYGILTDQQGFSNEFKKQPSFNLDPNNKMKRKQ